MRGHHDIHMYAEHPIHDPILVNKGQNAGEGVQDFTGYYDNDDGSEHDDHDGDDFYSFYDSDDMYANVDEHEVNANVPTEVAASQVGSRRVGKEPIIEHPPEVFYISDSSNGGGSGLEDDVELNHGVRDC